jgi:hypothetical protein
MMVTWSGVRSVVDDAVCYIEAHERVAFDERVEHVDYHTFGVGEEVFP